MPRRRGWGWNARPASAYVSVGSAMLDELPCGRTQQRDDLLQAEESLLETISKINKTARENFIDTFEKIRINFEKVFHSFFENGEGTIRLIQDQDPLEADIDIQVRTKGRRPQTLTLLSGGEKTLTAISLLFAIYLNHQEYKIHRHHLQEDDYL